MLSAEDLHFFVLNAFRHRTASRLTPDQISYLGGIISEVSP